MTTPTPLPRRRLFRTGLALTAAAAAAPFWRRGPRPPRRMRRLMPRRTPRRGPAGPPDTTGCEPS